MWFLLIVLTIILTTISGIVCHRIARKQEGDLVFWGVLGLLIGPAAIPITLLLAGRNPRRTRVT